MSLKLVWELDGDGRSGRVETGTLSDNGLNFRFLGCFVLDGVMLLVVALD